MSARNTEEALTVYVMKSCTHVTRRPVVDTVNRSTVCPSVHERKCEAPHASVVCYGSEHKADLWFLACFQHDRLPGTRRAAELFHRDLSDTHVADMLARTQRFSSVAFGCCLPSEGVEINYRAVQKLAAYASGP